MTLDEMKAAYETIDSSTVSENNIPDWDNDNLSVIRSKMKAIFKNINNTITAKEEDKPEEKKPETNNNSLGISKEAAKDIKDKADKLVSDATVVDGNDKKEEEKIDYTTTEKAPNGKTYEENDIKYLMNNGYTKEDAIKFLSTHEKYTKKEEKTSTGALSNESANEKKEITNPSDNISIQMLEAQNRTNELLSAILQAITNNTDSTTTQKTNESTVKADKIKHLKEKFNDAKTTIGMILSPSQVGLGREFSGGSTSSSASKIIPALNALTTM
jgi:hypothetical protein